MKHITTLVAGLAILATIAAAQDAVAQTTLRFGKIPSTVRNVGSLYLHVAERKGYFAREGIKLEVGADRRRHRPDGRGHR